MKNHTDGAELHPAGGHASAPRPTSAFADLGLRSELLAALRARGYERPTPIQARSVPQLLEGRDLLGVAQFNIVQAHDPKRRIEAIIEAIMNRDEISNDTPVLTNDAVVNFLMNIKYSQVGRFQATYQTGNRVADDSDRRRFDWFHKSRCISKRDHVADPGPAANSGVESDHAR